MTRAALPTPEIEASRPATLCQAGSGCVAHDRRSLRSPPRAELEQKLESGRAGLEFMPLARHGPGVVSKLRFLPWALVAGCSSSNLSPQHTTSVLLAAGDTCFSSIECERDLV